MPDDLFPGFASHWLDTQAGRIFARVGGSGPPVVLLHGFPQTHAAFHRIAPALAQTNTVVCMDLRGYGWSSAPRGDAAHETYSKRAMGADVITVMEQLGHVRFAVVGHDRGARVGYRLALDHPGRVARLALLDILPTAEVWRRIEAGAMPAAHWGFLAQPEPEPEVEIGKDPLAYFHGLLTKWSGGGLGVFDPGALGSYDQSCNEPNRIHAFCEDYRAGATVDRAQDEADLAAGKHIACPVLLVWAEFYLTSGGKTAANETPLEVWRRTFAPHAAGAHVRTGHFVAEEDPARTLAALTPFLGETP
jgi:haloacetate dehalogenase